MGHTLPGRAEQIRQKQDPAEYRAFRGGQGKCWAKRETNIEADTD